MNTLLLNYKYKDKRNYYNENKKQTTFIAKLFKGIKIYFKDYIIFLKGNTIKLFKYMNYATYHWGFQMILFLGMTESLGSLNVMVHQFSPYLIHEGVK